MIGITLCYRPSGLEPAARDRMSNCIRTGLTRIPNQSVEEFSTNQLFGACAHHGILPSGGTAQNEERLVAISGSCWIDSQASKLATPQEILIAWQRGTKGCAPSFGGSFAMAHFDGESNELTVITDRFGVIPIYYRRWGDTLLVSSEMKLLLSASCDVLDFEAVAEMMALGYLSRAHTLIAGIHRMPANHLLVYNHNGLKTTGLPSIGYPRNKPVDDEAIEEYDRLVQRYLSRFVNAAPSFSISLSGGLDSRLLAVAAQRAGIPQVAFSMGEPGSSDLEMATRVAEMLAIPIQTHELDGCDLPGWFGKVAWFTEGRVAPNHIHYMRIGLGGCLPPGPQLHGLVGEAVFGGHFDSPGLVHASPESINAACIKFARGLIYWPRDTGTTTFAPILAGHVQSALDLSVQEIMERIGYSGRYQDLLAFKWCFRFEGFTIPCLLSQVLLWTDVVTPFLDKDVFDFAAGLEAHGLQNRRAQIRWAKNHMPVITKLPRIKDGIAIPIREDASDAYDKGMRFFKHKARVIDALCLLSRGRINLSYGLSFPIYGQWYRRWPSVQNYVDGILLSDRSLDRGLWSRQGIRRLLRDLRTGRHVWNAVGTLLLVELLARQFIDGTDRPSDFIVPLGLDG